MGLLAGDRIGVHATQSGRIAANVVGIEKAGDAVGRVGAEEGRERFHGACVWAVVNSGG